MPDGADDQDLGPDARGTGVTFGTVGPYTLKDDGDGDHCVSVTHEDDGAIGLGFSGIRKHLGDDREFRAFIRALSYDPSGSTTPQGASPSPSEIARDPKYWTHTNRRGDYTDTDTDASDP